jgi:hypothetical protein
MSKCLKLSPVIHVTIKQDYLNIIKLLLSYRADLFIKDNCDATVIKIA